MPQLITLDSYFNGAPRTPELVANAANLLLKVNSLLQDLGISQAKQTSGYRTPAHNVQIGGARNSKHCLAQAVDLADNDRRIGDLLTNRQDLLVKRGMAMEDLRYCVRASGAKWVHLQDGLPASGHTIFIPYSGSIIYK